MGNRIQCGLSNIIPPPQKRKQITHVGSVVRLKLARGEGCGHSEMVTAVLTASFARIYRFVFGVCL